jgi:hypothetical protein
VRVFLKPRNRFFVLGRFDGASCVLVFLEKRLELSVILGLIITADPGEEGGGAATILRQRRWVMDSIFPGLGANPFNTKPLADYFNTGRKAEAASASKPAAGFPTAAEKSDSEQNKVALPGRGKLVDYLV